MYKKRAHIHFVGIGGIGMSGIAQILRYQGYRISGCDLDLSQKSIRDLKSIGCEIYSGNNTPKCQSNDIDILVYSSAIKPNDPEILHAQKRGIPTIPRALMLAELMRTKYSVAIAGSHGKTTTTSLVSHVLIEAGMDPTVVIGGHLKNISANARIGKGDFLIAEADESDRSLLHLQATLAIITNIDLEHLETYSNLDDIKETFSRFISSLPFYGKAFVCIDDKNLRSILPIPHVKTVKYGINNPEAHICATNVNLAPDHSTFDVIVKGQANPVAKIKINMPGHHNVLNTMGTIALATDLGIPWDTITKALASFKGIERRFCYRGKLFDAEIFDDYGHHPTEIKNTLAVARNRARGRLTVVFQPHRYSRTKGLWSDFVKVLSESKIDNLVVTDIHPASETPIAGISGENLALEVGQSSPPSSKIEYYPLDEDFNSIMNHLRSISRPNDLILLLGAGKIFKLAEKAIQTP